MLFLFQKKTVFCIQHHEMWNEVFMYEKFVEGQFLQTIVSFLISFAPLHCRKAGSSGGLCHPLCGAKEWMRRKKILNLKAFALALSSKEVFEERARQFFLNMHKFLKS